MIQSVRALPALVRGTTWSESARARRYRALPLWTAYLTFWRRGFAHPMPYSIIYICLCLLASILATKEPCSIFDKFCLREPDSAGSRRRSDLELIYETPRTDCFECSFTVGAARLCNANPASVRTLYQRPCFKGHLFRYLLKAARRQKLLLV